jgi:hypothetical protein
MLSVPSVLAETAETAAADEAIATEIEDQDVKRATTINTVDATFPAL